VIRSGELRTLKAPDLTATGYLFGSFRRGSKNVPLPCISLLATNAFQYVIDPKPVYVARSTPFSP
jgi:hypothetical protein